MIERAILLRDAGRLAAEIYSGKEDYLTIGQLGCVIGTHTGPGAFVVAFVPKE